MILDQLNRANLYDELHDGFARAFRFLLEAELEGLPPGRREVVPNLLYANVDHMEGRGRSGAVLEAHRKFIDIQYTLSGAEEIGWRNLAACERPREAFDESRDIGFFRDPVVAWCAVPPGYFAIFFPSDAHAPLAGAGPLRKVIMKVAVDWPE